MMMVVLVVIMILVEWRERESRASDEDGVLQLVGD